MSTKATVLITALGVINIGLACFFVGTVVSDRRAARDSGISDQEDKSDGSDRSDASDSTGSSCEPCRESRPTQLPQALLAQASANWGEALCRSEVGKYKQMLEDIQHWCNPYCQDELEVCQYLLTSAYPATHRDPRSGIELVLR
jgi:hypothetical protein